MKELLLKLKRLFIVDDINDIKENDHRLITARVVYTKLKEIENNLKEI